MIGRVDNNNMSNNNNPMSGGVIVGPKKYKQPVFGFKLFYTGSSDNGAIFDISDLENQMNKFAEELPEYHVIDNTFFETIGPELDIVIMRYVKYDPEAFKILKQQNDLMLSNTQRPSYHSSSSLSGAMAGSG